MVRHSLRDAAPVQAFQAPRTPFNGRLTPRRSFACSVASLAEAKDVKRAFDVKLNDVVLAVVGGALRSYLLNLGELPDDPLIAQVPVSLRTEADRDEVGTKVGAMFASMATDLEDPVERLRAIHDSTESAKEMYQEISSAHQVNLTDTMAPGVISLLARAYTAAGLEGRTPPVFNLIVSNVPGPPFDLYLAGARVEAMYPMGPLLYGSGVNCTVLSTADQLDFGFMACPDLMPDPWDLADRIPPALAELHAAIP
jgi:WS/DGAT/MGAT family acyltransferase